MLRRATLYLGAVVLLAVAFSLIPAAIAAEATAKGKVLVGRLSFIDGEILYYVPESKEWVLAVKDAPFGLDDAFYSGEDGKAEFVLPNRTRLRIGATTQIQLVALKDDLAQVDIASGMGRFFNDSDSAIMKVTTPFGYVVAESGGSFDLYVGDSSVEVLALEGTVNYVGDERSAKYEVTAGSSILANATTVTDSSGTVDADWNAWNEQRDTLWAKQVEVKGDSVAHLPGGLYDQASVLDEHGRWEKVQYEGEERDLWRPTGVGPEWEPFTAGRWTVYHGDSAWIPEDEPFGFVTHHYGNWVFVDPPGAWYWIPPAPVAPVRPGFDIAFSWYPGRVGWIHSGLNVGWFPLAPFEPFYAHRFWGPRTVVVRDVTRVNININRFRFVNRAVVIPQNSLFSVRNYRNSLIRDINRARLLRDFRAAPFLDRRVVRNLRRMNQRFQFTPAVAGRVPHSSVIRRIRHNRRIAARAGQLRANTVERNLRRLRQGTLARNVALQQPRVTNRLVNRNQVNQARRQLNFEQRQLKRQAVQLQRVQERRQRAQQLRRQRQAQRQVVNQQRRQQQRTQQIQRQRQNRQQQLQRQSRQRAQRLQQQRQRRLQVQQQRQRQNRQQQLQRQNRQRAQRLQQQRQRRLQVQQQRRQQQLQRQSRQRAQRLQQQRQRRLQVQQQRQRQNRQQQLQRQSRQRAQRLQQQRQRRLQVQQQRRQQQRQQIQRQSRQRAQRLQQQRQRRLQVQQQRRQQQSRQQIQRQRQRLQRAQRTSFSPQAFTDGDRVLVLSGLRFVIEDFSEADRSLTASPRYESLTHKS